MRVARKDFRAGGTDWSTGFRASIERNSRTGNSILLSLIAFGLVTTLLSYGLFRIQDILPLKQNVANLTNTVDKTGAIVGATVDPATGKLSGGGKISAIIAFIQAVSFSTNTDWQSYEPEQTLTYFSQTVTTAMHFFFSAAVGISVAAVVVRGVSRKQTRDIGNFWVDLTRITLYLFIPICLVYSLVLVSQGTPMNFKPYTAATTIDQSGAASPGSPVVQTISQGPMASYCAPKVLGLNGPGFTGADCAHPFENPTPLSEFLQLMLFFSIIAGLPYYYGRMIKKYPTRVEHLGCDVHPSDQRNDRYLVFRVTGESAPRRPGPQSRQREHGRERSPHRHLQLSHLGQPGNGHRRRREQLSARFSFANGRLRPDVQHASG